MTRGLVLLALVAAAPLEAQTGRLDPLEYVEFRLRDHAAAYEPRAGAHDVDIDRTIIVEWDEAAFARALDAPRRVAARGDPLEGRIAFLRGMTDQFLEAQRLLVNLRSVAGRLESARRTGDSARIAQLRREFRDANAAFAAAASDGLRQIDALAQAAVFQGAPELVSALRAGIERALLEGDYTNVAQVLDRELRALEGELLRRIEAGDSIRVYMTAWIVSGGARRQIHLDGYDDVTPGAPVPFPRVQFAVDERTRRELESAETLADLVENSDALVTQVHEAAAAFRGVVGDIRTTAGLDALEARLDRVVRALREEADAGLQDLLRQAVSVGITVESLLDLAPPAASGRMDAQLLTAFATRFDRTVRELEVLIRQAGRDLPALASALERDARDLALQEVTELVAALRAAGDRLPDEGAIRELIGRLREIGDALGLTERVTTGAGHVGAIGRRLGPNPPLDTTLDLLTAGERHPGDLIVLQVRVSGRRPGGETTVLASGRQLFKLRALGFYAEPRGALLFVDPRGTAFETQDFEPAVSLSYIAHWGIRSAGFWNDILNPGIGLTLSLLDFEDGRDFELGIGGSLTILRDLLFFGYGRNLTAEVDFFYVGVNPLAIGQLFRQSRPGVGATP